MMKKTYNFKPLGVMTFVFDALLLLSGFVLLTMMGSMSGLGALSSLGTILNSVIFFLAGLLGMTVSAIFLYIYYMKKEKVLSVLADAIANTVIVVVYVFALLAGISGGLFIIGLFLVFILTAGNLAILLRLDGVINLDMFDIYLPAGKNATSMTNETMAQAASETMTQQTQETVSSQPKEPVLTGEKIKTFFKSKNGKITIGLLIGIVCLFAGYKVWDQFFNKTQIDAFEGMTVTFDGYNGAGKAEIDKPDIDYDQTDLDMSVFISGIDYEVEKDGELSNGDKVKVVAKYSEETAKSLKVVLKEESREFEVNGLTVQYQSASEIDKDLFKKAYQDVDKKSKSSLYSDSKYEFYKAYYAWQPDKKISLQSNKLIFVYKETYKGYDYEKHADTDKVRYVSYYVTFNSSYESDKGYISSRNLYKADSYEYVEKEEDVFDALKYSYSRYTTDQDQFEEVKLAVE